MVHYPRVGIDEKASIAMGRMSLDSFLGHKSRDAGAAYLEKWKDDGQIDILLHTRADIASKWTHGLVEVKLVKGEGDDAEEVPRFRWTGYTCWEAESVLQRQFKRDQDTGRRKFPPVICPDCLLLEWLREQVESGEMDWTTPVFKFKAIDKDGDEEVKLYHAGGLYGAFGAKDMSDEQVDSLKEAKIVRREAWKEGILAKMSYVFSVLPYANPEKGIVVATETALLGDKVKTLIMKTREEFGDDEGDPRKNPYVIRWKFDNGKNTPFDKKYDAVRMSKMKITPEMLEAIEGDPPDIDPYLRVRDPYAHRAMLEEACCLKKGRVPWDAIFGRACRSWDKMKEKEKGSKHEEDDGESKPPAKKPQGKATTKSAAKPRVELCEECGEPLSKAGKCLNPDCGANTAPDPDPTNNTDDDDLPF